MRTKLLASVFALAVTATPAPCNKKPVQDCKVTFAVVYLDRLNNTNNGIPPKNVKDSRMFETIVAIVTSCAT